MPLRMVWPDSWSVETRNDGSSAASVRQRDAHLFLVGLVFGSTAISMTGSGNSMRSSMTGFCGSHSVSPVRVP